MERLKRYKKRIVSLMCAIMIGAIGICSTSFNSEASATGVNNGIEYFVNYAEPAKSDSEGYITLLLQSSTTGEFVVETYFWYCCAVSNGVTSPCYMTLNVTSSSVKFSPGGNGANITGAFYSLGSMASTGRYSIVNASSTSAFTVDLARWNWVVRGYKYAGNVGNMSVSGVNNDSYLFSIYFANDGSAMLLMDIISLLQSSNNIDSSILSTVQGILGSVDGVEDQLSSVITYLQSVDHKLGEIWGQLNNIYSKADEILNEQKQSNTWLGKIWNSIQEFINPSDDDSQKTDEFNDEANAQKSEIDELNEQNQTNKVDVDAAVSDVDANINFDDMAQYGGVLATITNNDYILQLILVVVSIAIIAYVLFGKR